MTQENENKVNDQEKEKTAEEEEQEEQDTGDWIELPPVTFENYILGLRNTALIHLGFRDPETGKIIRNLPFARHTIDTLGMIQEKTKGNLTAPESNLLENLLYELRISYLRADKDASEERVQAGKGAGGDEAEEEKASETQSESEAGKGENEKAGK